MSFFLIVLIVGKKSKVHSDIYLICMLAVYGITIGGAYIEIFNLNNNYPFPHLMNNAWLFLLLYGPFIWLYIKSLTTKGFKFKYIYLIHFSPFVIYLALHYFNFFRLSAEEKIFLTQTESFTTTLFFKIRGLSIAFSTIGYNIWALILLHKHKQNIVSQFSNIENIDLKWLRTFVIASLFIFSLNVFLFNLNNYIHFTGFYSLSEIAYSFSTIYVLYIGYYGLRQGSVFVDSPAFENQQNNPSMIKKQVPDTLKTKGFNEIIDKLSKLMEEKQPYLDPDISLAKLNNLVQTKPEILSEVLNSVLNQSFFDYINKQRIEEFKIQCLNKNKKHLSIMGIAYECGFNSKAAFYRAFNKFEGSSPTAYISKVSYKCETLLH